MIRKRGVQCGAVALSAAAWRLREQRIRSITAHAGERSSRSAGRSERLRGGIRPRTIYTIEWDLLPTSVAKTGRLVVADDTAKTCGLACEIIVTIAEEMRLRSTPRWVTRADIAVPFMPVLERAVIPPEEAIFTAVRDVAGEASQHE